MRSTLPGHEDARAILVVDSKRRVTYRDVARKDGESIEDYADRVRAAVVEQLTKVNS